jgi:HPt (histidine-containing phosphotransfer) domain-containing protein
MDDHLAKPFSRQALHATVTRWLTKEPQAAPRPLSLRVHSADAPAPATSASSAETPAKSELLLDHRTLDALRALPRKGPKDMLSHIAERYLSDSQQLVAAIERSLDAGEAADLARAAHAWRSYNGNVGALSLAGLCRELEDNARHGNLAEARELYVRIRVLHERVRDELQCEMRRSA